MVLQTGTLSSWYMLFQQQAIIANSESAKHDYKNHTAFAEHYLYLSVSNTWFGYWLNWIKIIDSLN